MISDNNSNQAAAPPLPSGRGHQGSPRITQDHPGAPRLARRSPASRENKAALTLDLVGGEVGADFCLLGMFMTRALSSCDFYRIFSVVNTIGPTSSQDSFKVVQRPVYAMQDSRLPYA